MGGRVAAATVKGQINVFPWEACMHACGEPGACRVVRSAFTRRWWAGGYWRLAVVAVVAAPADVSQWVSARGAAGRRARVCRHTDSTHGVCPRAHVWSARRTRSRRRSSKLGAGDDSRETARGAYARLAVFWVFALRIAHAACTRDHGNACYQDPSFMYSAILKPQCGQGAMAPAAPPAARAPPAPLQFHNNITS